MKIAIRGGHNFGVPGAHAILDEVTEDRKYYKALMNCLEHAGHQVLDVTPDRTDTSAQDLTYGASKANAWGADLFVSCHLNAGGGQGCEVLYFNGSQKGKEYATKVTNGIATLGFVNRGAKADIRGLYELKATHMPAIIIEPLFVDTQSDVDLYNQVGIDRLAKAIAEAINGSPIDVKKAEPPKQSNSDDCNTYDFKSLQHEIGVTEDNIPGPITLSNCPLTKIGAKGNIIKWIQNRLNYLGFNCGIVDGDFGSKTLAAIKAFQCKYGLDVDGIIGQNTWKKLLGL
ncbi:N-acetylmuramoyl-L-alanine amidase [Clostridium lundense]|uniref:N-acetylmuramoyl-L-alanine amidase n=1 Tax=Clostridium lundense TaxID=319475 RepID=UPI000486B57D|nr:N-acetylmuramoyl-L-alanine amidase [Clostridium lundense]